MDGIIYYWRLNQDYLVLTGDKKQGSDKNPMYKFEYKYGRFTDIAIKTENVAPGASGNPGKPNLFNGIFAVTEDHQIRELERSKELTRYETPSQFS